MDCQAYLPDGLWPCRSYHSIVGADHCLKWFMVTRPIWGVPEPQACKAYNKESAKVNNLNVNTLLSLQSIMTSQAQEAPGGVLPSGLRIAPSCSIAVSSHVVDVPKGSQQMQTLMFFMQHDSMPALVSK